MLKYDGAVPRFATSNRHVWAQNRGVVEYGRVTFGVSCGLSLQKI